MEVYCSEGDDTHQNVLEKRFGSIQIGQDVAGDVSRINDVYWVAGSDSSWDVLDDFWMYSRMYRDYTATVLCMFLIRS